MTVNQLMAALRKQQKLGNGQLKVHALAHDNCLGETQGTINSVSHFAKNSDDDHPEGRDEYLYTCIEDEIVYLHI